MAASLSTIAYTLPVFLVGALAVQLSDDLLFGVAGIGLAVGVFRGSAALASVHMGRLVDRLGSLSSLRLAAGIAAAAAVGLALTAASLLSLCVWLVLAGSGNALGQPAANRLLQRHVPPGRQGLAFGAKQAAVPSATMLAGLAVPAIALTVGWRWAFAAPALLFGALLIATAGVGGRTARPPGATQRASREPAGQVRLDDRATIVLLAASMGFGMAAASAPPTFFVDAAVVGGLRPETAGAALAMASVATIATRLLVGFAADRLRGGQMRICAAMVGTGAIGSLILATGSSNTLIVGLLLAMAGGWGFNGVLWYCLVRAYPETPGRATGAVAPGGLLGSSVGPVIFGTLVARTSYASGWLLVSVFAAIAAVFMLVAAQRLQRYDRSTHVS